LFPGFPKDYASFVVKLAACRATSVNVERNSSSLSATSVCENWVTSPQDYLQMRTQMLEKPGANFEGSFGLPKLQLVAYQAQSCKGVQTFFSALPFAMCARRGRCHFSLSLSLSPSLSLSFSLSLPLSLSVSSVLSVCHLFFFFKFDEKIS